LRIAGAQLTEEPGRSIADLVAVLAQGQRTLALQIDDDRDSALRAVFDLSIARLGPDAAMLFRRLGLLPVTDARTWVASVLGELDEARTSAALAQLADASLIVLAEDRFTLHDLVQVYARERADAADEAALRRLYETALAMAVQADTELDSRYFPSVRLLGPVGPARPRDIAGAAEWQEAERDLLSRAALDAAERGWTGIGWQLIASLTNFAGNMSFLAQWLETAERTLTLTPDGIGRAVLQLGLGGVYRLRGNTKEAIGLLRQARRTFTRAGQDVFAGTAATQISATARVTGQARTAQAAVDWAIARLGTGPVTPQLGWAYLVRGNLLRYIGAEPYAVWLSLDTALTILEETGDVAGQANAGVSIALHLRDDGRFEEAREHLITARKLLMTVEEDNTPALSVVEAALGRLNVITGRLDAAAVHSRDALDHARKLAQPYALTVALTLAGEVARQRGDNPGALRHLDEAEELARQSGVRSLLAPVRFEQAKVYAAEGDLRRARTTAEEARELYVQSGRDESEPVDGWLANLPTEE
jgi:tetratricopeptide (TPR) repeat protein